MKRYQGFIVGGALVAIGAVVGTISDSMSRGTIWADIARLLFVSGIFVLIYRSVPRSFWLRTFPILTRTGADGQTVGVDKRMVAQILVALGLLLTESVGGNAIRDILPDNFSLVSYYLANAVIFFLFVVPLSEIRFGKQASGVESGGAATLDESYEDEILNIPIKTSRWWYVPAFFIPLIVAAFSIYASDLFEIIEGATLGLLNDWDMYTIQFPMLVTIGMARSTYLRRNEEKLGIIVAVTGGVLGHVMFIVLLSRAFSGGLF